MREIDKIILFPTHKDYCRNCIYNDDGLCDRKGILVEDEDTCDKWSEGQVEWKERMLSTFLAGH